MTSEELRASHRELSRLADMIRTKLDPQSSDLLTRMLAEVGLVLSNIASTVADQKDQLDDVSAIQLRRGRSDASLRDERALRLFAELSPDERERLVRIVESAIPNISVSAFAQQIARESGLSNWQATELMQCISSWYSYLAEHQTEEDVAFVTSMLLDPFNTEPRTQEILRAVDASNVTSPFVQHVKRLLRCHASLGVSIKAEALLSRNEKQFSSATVSTDLRPVFSASVESGPSYGVVLHNLVLKIDDGGIFRSIGVALTSTDILTLAEVLNRAWKKENTLRQQNTYKLLPLR